MNDIKNLGQVFTPNAIVKQMIALRKNRGTVLEPSAGDGAFLSALQQTKTRNKVTAIEIDSRMAQLSGARCMDFFDLPADKKFDTIIGNPPYVRHADISKLTCAKLDYSLFDRRTNLYLFFIAKCIRHLNDGGELIFITPRDFTKATAAIKLNQHLFDRGTITEFIELGDARVFADASPNCAIWRFVKNDFSRKVNAHGKKFACVNGQIYFTGAKSDIPFNKVFTVKVGAVSGMDKVFANEQHGNRDFVCSKTATDGTTRRMIYNTPQPFLASHKQELLARKIRRFDERNWWQWGRAHYESTRPRIYVNSKTRRNAPFFLHPSCDYDGAVLAIFPHANNSDTKQLCAMLNQVNWDELGFVCGGRFLFNQRSLQDCMLPEKFAQYAVIQTDAEGINFTIPADLALEY